MPKKRKPEDYPTISQGADGKWHAWVTVGTKPNGRPDQRHVKRQNYEGAEARVDELLAQKRTGQVQNAGRAPTVQAWFEEVYFETVAPLTMDLTTIEGARKKLRRYAYPTTGKIRMDRLQPSNVTAVYVAMVRSGLADTTVLQVHRIIVRGLRVAFRTRVITCNLAELITPPTAKKKVLAAPTKGEADRVLAATDNRRSSTRWRCGFGLGLRQGEALGLRWPWLDIDSEQPEARIHWQLHRRPFLHGCSGSPCGRRRAGNCPQRILPLKAGEIQVEGGLILKPPKGSSYGEIPLPAELVEEFRRHREIQDFEKMMAGDAYVDRGFVFCDRLGHPISPEADWKEFQEIEAEAGVHLRVHDGRHFTASFLIALGVDSSVVQKILRHSSIKVTEGYLDASTELKREATSRMGQALRRPQREGNGW
ncbi:site-specific integrase [Actinoplanes oblitus]|uniref:Site-specific integrase n=1 Tax=Actinoplanes oblitus TaxID=3040509 RepID=A0ABY8WPV6_9ACTN|nr:site-specific integrase [Actinoplanes oblitus]WIM97800.1 site-specific integrase [Actinoplanes oblitus]